MGMHKKSNLMVRKSGYAKQFYRTARNTEMDHKEHAKKHPNDKQAFQDWFSNPIKTSK